jgi:hypothetical protein
MNVDRILHDITLQRGGLLEIYVFDTTIEDWRAVVEFLLQPSMNSSFTRQGAPVSGPISESMFNDGESVDYLLNVNVGDQLWTTNLYSIENVDFQGSPHDVNSSESIDLLVKFMHSLRSVTGKRVVLIPESVYPKDVEPYIEVG